MVDCVCFHTVLSESSKGTRLSDSLAGENESRMFIKVDSKVSDWPELLSFAGESLREKWVETENWT